MTTGSRLKKLREEKGLSQEEVAKLVGVSREARRFHEGWRNKVVINGDEGTLKRIRKDTNYITLEAANPDYPSRTFAGEKMNEVHIVGRIIELKRKY